MFSTSPKLVQFMENEMEKGIGFVEASRKAVECGLV
jgi:hypothetical protein